MADNTALWRSAQGRALLMSRDVGPAIRLARQSRGWRQADLAAACGYSVSTISRLETGRRPPADLDLVRRVAGAAGIPPRILGVLVGLLPPPPATVVTIATPTAEEDPDMRRRDLLAAAGLAAPARMLGRLDEALAVLPAAAGSVTAVAVTRRLVRARAMFDAGATLRLIGELPGLLATAQSAALARKEPGSYMLLAAWYDLATDALIKVGDVGASRITADRSVAYAGLSGSAAAMAYSARSLSIVLRHQDRRQLAGRVALDAATAVERTGLSTRLEAAAYAHILCTTAYSAATAGDHGPALDMIAEATRAAARLPGGRVPGYAVPVTPAQVKLYKVGVHWALGDAGAALQAASGLRAGQFLTPERRARMHTDLARAWWQGGRPEQAAAELLAAHSESPAEVTCRPAIRKMAEDITVRHPRVRGVRELRTVAITAAQG